MCTVGCACEPVGGCLFPSVRCQAHAGGTAAPGLTSRGPSWPPGVGFWEGPFTFDPKGSHPRPSHARVRSTTRTADKYKMHQESGHLLCSRKNYILFMVQCKTCG